MHGWICEGGVHEQNWFCALNKRERNQLLPLITPQEAFWRRLVHDEKA
jgi:hypothetical protein